MHMEAGVQTAAYITLQAAHRVMVLQECDLHRKITFISKARFQLGQPMLAAQIGLGLL